MRIAARCSRKKFETSYSRHGYQVVSISSMDPADEGPILDELFDAARSEIDAQSSLESEDDAESSFTRAMRSDAESLREQSPDASKNRSQHQDHQDGCGDRFFERALSSELSGEGVADAACTQPLDPCRDVPLGPFASAKKMPCGTFYWLFNAVSICCWPSRMRDRIGESVMTGTKTIHEITISRFPNTQCPDTLAAQKKKMQYLYETFPPMLLESDAQSEHLKELARDRRKACLEWSNDAEYIRGLDFYVHLQRTHVTEQKKTAVDRASKRARYPGRLRLRAATLIFFCCSSLNRARNLTSSVNIVKNATRRDSNDAEDVVSDCNPTQLLRNFFARFLSYVIASTGEDDSVRAVVTPRSMIESLFSKYGEDGNVGTKVGNNIENQLRNAIPSGEEEKKSNVDHYLLTSMDLQTTQLYGLALSIFVFARVRSQEKLRFVYAQCRDIAVVQKDRVAVHFGLFMDLVQMFGNVVDRIAAEASSR